MAEETAEETGAVEGCRKRVREPVGEDGIFEEEARRSKGAFFI
jgi:hypothetical protein